jgi:hypothetical protein
MKIYKNGQTKEELLRRNAEKDRIVMNVPKGRKRELFNQAKSRGMMFTPYVLRLIELDKDCPSQLLTAYTSRVCFSKGSGLVTAQS